MNFKAIQIYDSRGKPTIEVSIEHEGIIVNASVPSGASTGIHEAVELRDGNSNEWFGFGVKKAIFNVINSIADCLKKYSCIKNIEQKEIDKALIDLDGTTNKARLGSNAILGVSLAYTKLKATLDKTPLYDYISSKLLSKDARVKNPSSLPLPAFNVINGGVHAGNSLAFQEFMIIPTGADTFSQAMRIGSECYHTLKGILINNYGRDACNVGDEGGFAPPIKTHREAILLLIETIKKTGYEGKASIAIDVAASGTLDYIFYFLEFYDAKTKTYDVGFKSISQKLSSSELIKLYIDLFNEFGQWIVSIEDPFDQDDWDSWSTLTRKLEGKIQIVGDDLTVTNSIRIQKAIELKACNCLLLKLNQIGTLTEAINAAELAFSSGWNVMVSHRSGETEDTFIADLAYAIGCGQIKSGAPCRSERVGKYNRLLRIEHELNDKAYLANKFSQNKGH